MRLLAREAALSGFFTGEQYFAVSCVETSELAPINKAGAKTTDVCIELHGIGSELSR